MELRPYLQSHKVIPERVVQDAINNSVKNRRTLFEELLTNCGQYEVDEKLVLKVAEDASDGEVRVLTTTKGLKPYLQGYRDLGGVEVCVTAQVLCVSDEEDTIVFVMMRPDDTALLHKIDRVMNGVPYSIAIAPSFIFKTIHDTDVEPLRIEAMSSNLSAETDNRKEDTGVKRESEARRIYTSMLNLGIDRGASDIHIMPLQDKCHILYRIDGTNYKLMEIPKEIGERISNILCTDASVQRKGELTAADGKVRYIPQGDGRRDTKPRDLRFSILPSTKGTDINVRYLNDKMYTFEQLGMSERNVRLYKELLARPQGLIMQVGPTGSGKSTTLYTGLQYIRQQTLRNIITVEDPVEIYMDGITQVSTNDKSGLTFANVIRQFLRHDVDVGIVGEIRDEETALEAVRAATTGHLIISSLHTNDSIGVFERLIRLGVDSYTLGDVLVAIMSQRLVRRLCPHCKEKYELKLSDPKARHFRLPEGEGTMPFYRAVGCEHCHNIGYSGRVAVNEILQIDGQMRHFIQMHSPRQKYEEYLRGKGFITMYADALEKAKAGFTSLEELEPMCSDTLAFKADDQVAN